MKMTVGRAQPIRVLPVLLAFSLLGAASPGPATAPGARGADVPRAKKTSTRSTSASESQYDQLRYDDAITLLAEMVDQGTAPADQLVPAREILARCYVKKGYPVLAKDMFKANLRARPGYRPSPIRVPPDEWVVFEQARKELVSERSPDAVEEGSLHDLEGVAGSRDGTASTMLLEIRVRPYASFYLDKVLKAQDLAITRMRVTPGVHQVRVVHPTLGAREWTVEAEAGTVKRLSHDFLMTPSGSVRVSSAGIWAEVYVDGVNTGAITPCVVEGLMPGRHTVTIYRARFTAVGQPQVVTVGAGESAVARFKLAAVRAR